jgi:hypothetical protein
MMLTQTQAEPRDANELLALHDATFVRAAYRSLLGRPADDEGMRFYVGRLRAGVSKDQVVLELADSPEATQRGEFTLPGLQALRMRQPSPPSIAQRIFKRLLGPALEPILTRLRIIENAIGRSTDDRTSMELARRTADKLDLLADRIRALPDSRAEDAASGSNAGRIADIRTVTEMRRFLGRGR